MARVFENKPAKREKVPLLIGLMGPSGGGKTYSALRIATGIQRVSGGDIFVIDTEARRSLHYADTFRFEHVEFGEPFSPLDYLAAIEHCVKKGAGVIVVDSMSHEHEGPGGVLEMHQQQVDKLSKGDPSKAGGVSMLAWAKPKAERRRLINTMMQLSTNLVFCFRAKEKLKMPPRGSKEEPKSRGWIPIAGEEFIYEMTCCALLPPNSDGTPRWKTEHPDGEGLMMKLPRQFVDLLNPGGRPQQLDEAKGEAMAAWASGVEAEPDDETDVVFEILAASSVEDLTAISAKYSGKRWSKRQRKVLREARDKRREELETGVTP